jgi:ribonuclease P protein component
VETRYRFPKSRRLTRDAEFRHVRTEGKSVRGELITLAFLKNADESETRQSQTAATVRAGFITSKRVGSAVVRNRTRRRLREIFRKHQHEIAPGMWLVVIATSRAARVSFPKLEDEWLRLVQRASILAP